MVRLAVRGDNDIRRKALKVIHKVFLSVSQIHGAHDTFLSQPRITNAESHRFISQFQSGERSKQGNC